MDFWSESTFLHLQIICLLWLKNLDQSELSRSIPTANHKSDSNCGLTGLLSQTSSCRKRSNVPCKSMKRFYNLELDISSVLCFYRNANFIGAVTVNTSPLCSNVAASILSTVLLVCCSGPRRESVFLIRRRTYSSIYSTELTITSYSPLSLQMWRWNVSFYPNPAGLDTL